MNSRWKFQALQLGHAFVWLWIAFDDSGAITQKSARLFPSYRAVVSDATNHGFNVSHDGWEFVNAIGAPLSERGSKA